MALSGQRFKIDYYDSSWSPFALYRCHPGLFWNNWVVIDRFETREKCRELYERVKDLPEYLD